MKKTVFGFLKIVAVSACMVVLFSCATNKGPEEPDPNFIADISPFEFDSCQLLSGKGNDKPDAIDITYTFNPRTNEVWAGTEVSIDDYLIVFSYEDRLALADAMNQYLALYEAGNLPEQKPKKKNAITKGSLKVYWGVFGYAYNGYTEYYTGYQYLEKGKPYFFIDMGQAYDSEEDAYSPLCRIYLSPAQIRKQFDILNQNRLVDESKAGETELYEFD